MATQPTAPPAIVELPPAPNSSTDTPSEFDAKANNTVAAQVVMVPQINTANDWAKQTAGEVYSNALEAADSAASASNSADVATSAANIVGKWSDLSGVYAPPVAVEHNGLVWILLVIIADISTSEPSTSNSDWLLSGSTSKTYILGAGETLLASVINEAQATQANPLPLAASVPANTTIRITVPETYKGITTTHLVSGSDTTTDSNGTLPSVDDPIAGFIFNWPSGGTLFVTSNGVDNWRY